MPLEPARVARVALHLRRVEMRGFKREDGLIDIEGRLLDTKEHDFVPGGDAQRVAPLAPGEAVHDMWLRITLDQRLEIVDAKAIMDGAPYRGYCDTIVPDYRKLIGLTLAPGFQRALKARLGGTHGCSHMTELASMLATVAFQTMASIRPKAPAGVKPFQLDRCHALETSKPAVAKFYPEWYKKK